MAVTGWSAALRRNHLGIYVFELPVAVGVLRALVRLAVRLPAVAERRNSLRTLLALIL